MLKKAIGLIITILLFLQLFAPTLYASVIHIVNPGETLWEISDQYNVNQHEVAKINGISNQNKIVPGQSLILNTDQYVVQKGDTLWEIANRHRVSLSELKNINDIKSDMIHVGQNIQVPKPSKSNIMIGAFAYPSDIIDGKVEHKYTYLSHISAFEYHPKKNGELNELPKMKSFKNILWKKGTVPYATVTNLSPDGFDAKLAHELLTNKKKRTTLIENIYGKLQQYDLEGVVIDFEGLDSKDRDDFNQFIQQLATRIHPVGMQLGVAVPPLQGNRNPSWNAAYDYKTLGQYANYLFLMTYDWHWLGGEPGPIAPIDRVKETLEYGLSVMPKEKIVMGIPLYAYDWPINNGKSEAQAYAQMSAIEKAIEYGSTIHYDEENASPWFRYTDEKGFDHEVWFEDARSILAKYQLVKDLDILGIGGWQIKFSFPQSERIIKEHFNIR
ncbi:glycosyl hydrolase family 18 protein [Tenuibacillus multivorans]|uniref:Spore germination protein n=1 Tax=Tenuibacillus multivorans TaxID=237069 RepID=A0A1H0CM79_9BACI|nr:LysM peptidoglycan-binding domain-containing protein [Tenuibacillus multivorans]GEL76242.1 putative sporulation-specific glycosylase YdhD [Tenuibacillus multivorans]SDN58943.1 spore germination protein [Tenuibacillus multivorans]